MADPTTNTLLTMIAQGSGGLNGTNLLDKYQQGVQFSVGQMRQAQALEQGQQEIRRSELSNKTMENTLKEYETNAPVRELNRQNQMVEGANELANAPAKQELTVLELTNKIRAAAEEDGIPIKEISQRMGGVYQISGTVTDQSSLDRLKTKLGRAAQELNMPGSFEPKQFEQWRNTLLQSSSVAVQQMQWKQRMEELDKTLAARERIAKGRPSGQNRPIASRPTSQEIKMMDARVAADPTLATLDDEAKTAVANDAAVLARKFMDDSGNTIKLADAQDMAIKNIKAKNIKDEDLGWMSKAINKIFGEGTSKPDKKYVPSYDEQQLGDGGGFIPFSATEEELDYTAQKYNMTREEVLELISQKVGNPEQGGAE